MKLYYNIFLLFNIFILTESFIRIPFLVKNKNLCSLLISNSSNTDSYLNSINKPLKSTRDNIFKNIPKSNDTNVKKLEKIQNNIQKYISNKNHIVEPGFKSTYQIIPKATFDTIFLNINQIQKVYLSYNKDRLIFELLNNKRYVYYIKNKDDYDKMEKFLFIIPHKIKIIIINDVENTMNDPFGYLYCEPK
jgi:hypothetical protein